MTALASSEGEWWETRHFGIKTLPYYMNGIVKRLKTSLPVLIRSVTSSASEPVTALIKVKLV